MCNKIVIKIAYLITRQYYNYSKDLKVKHIVYILKRSIKLSTKQ